MTTDALQPSLAAPGQRLPTALRANLPRLLTAYYALVPDVEVTT